MSDIIANLDGYTDAQVLALARNIDDGTDMPGISYVGDTATLTDRAAFVGWLRRRDGQAEAIADH